MEKKSEIEPVINDLVKMTEMCYEKDKEIERLNGALQTHEILLKSNVLEIESLNNIINEISSIIEYWGYDKEHNDISSFRMAMKNIKDILDRK